MLLQKYGSSPCCLPSLPNSSPPFTTQFAASSLSTKLRNETETVPRDVLQTESKIVDSAKRRFDYAQAWTGSSARGIPSSETSRSQHYW
jgi:hypothetical protein